MNRNKLAIFYISVTFLSGIDLVLLIGIIWKTLLLTGSALSLGIIISLSTLIPFLIRKIIVEKLQLIEHISLNFSLVLRMLVYAVLLITLLRHSNINTYWIVVIASAYGVINFLTLSALEFCNSSFVLTRLIIPKNAARLMQSAIQIGASIGSMLGGYLIGGMKFNTFLILLMCLNIAIAIIVIIAFKYKKVILHNIDPTVEAVQHHIDKVITTSINKHDLPVLFLCFALGIIGFHIGAFNITVPIVYQNSYHWNATLLGITSGVAGIGALLATFLPNRVSNAKLFCVIILLSDFALIYLANIKVAIVGAFFIGMSINYLRIILKEQLILLSITKLYAEKLASLSTLYFLLFQALSPLVVSLLLTAIGNKYASLVFVQIGLLLGISIIFSLYYSNKLLWRLKNV